jgi:hypothetical protein
MTVDELVEPESAPRAGKAEVAQARWEHLAQQPSYNLIRLGSPP